MIDYDSMAMERSLRRRIFINYTITLAQTDIEVNIKSHIMLYKMIKLCKKQFYFLTFCANIFFVFYVIIGEMTCLEHD